jgi:hypothetical protein
LVGRAFEIDPGVTMKPEILLIDPMMPPIEAAMDERFRLHRL